MHSKLDFVDDWKRLAHEEQYEPRRLARRCGVSLRQLERFFHARFGVTPKAWMEGFRFDQAVELIVLGEPLKSTAYKLGFKQPSHFSRSFKQICGMSPRTYVAQLLARAPRAEMREHVAIR